MESTTPITFQQNVTTSGTPVQLTDIYVDSQDTKLTVVIKAKKANTGTITIGNSSANALNSGTAHFKLAPGDSISLAVDDSRQVWIDSTVNGEGVEGLIG